MKTKKQKTTTRCIRENTDCGKMFMFESFDGPSKKNLDREIND